MVLELLSLRLYLTALCKSFPSRFPSLPLLPFLSFLRWTAGYFASIKFFEQRVEEVIKLVRGKDFDVKKDQGAVVFAQLVSGTCMSCVHFYSIVYPPAPQFVCMKPQS